MKPEWKEEICSFKVLDVRKLEGNILPMILYQAESVEVGEGITIIQSLEPKPLYSSLEKTGFTHHLEKVSPSEYHASFYRMEKREKTYPEGSDIPLKLTALLNYKAVSDELA